MKITPFLDLITQLAYTPPTWASLACGVFVLITLSLSIYLVFEHLSAYKNPEEQKFLIGVVLMVPCYAIESLVSFLNPSISVYCEILRDCYESFAMYCFGRYLVACLGGEERTIEFMEREGRASSKTPLLEHSSERGTVKHPFPVNYILKPWKLGQWFYQVVKFGIVQYMLIKSLSAIVAVILEAFDVYCEGDFNLGCGCEFAPWGLMGIASVVHLYVFPAKPYEMMGDRFAGTVSVLGDYVSADCPLDPEEVRDSERPTKLRLPTPDIDVKSGMTIRESVRDVFIGGGEYGHRAELYAARVAKSLAALDGREKVNVDDLKKAVELVILPRSIISENPPEQQNQQPPPPPPPPQNEQSGEEQNAEEEKEIVQDVKFTVTQAVEPVEKGFTRFNEKLHKISENIKKHDKEKRKTRDDSCISTSPTRKVIRGIDDPLLNGSMSDSGVARANRHRRKSGYTSAESGGESGSDQSYGGFQVRGRRWVTKD
ncbi:hypothetical protein C1H46_019325 [Malus baccata]|uniref:magnesium chelatase n=1 Tax=Malus baccata TaxID=106549 RepID=A0A540M8H6_MALBA|nr:hypothetical protein C1H46_019325 [Malus baccata]